MTENVTFRRVPRVGYAWTMVALAVALALVLAALVVWRWLLPPLEHDYVWTYLWLGMQAHVPTLPHHTNRAMAGYLYLRGNVFGKRGVAELFRSPLISSGVLFAVALFFGMGLDAKRLNDFRKGKKLRGWDILTPRQFNRRTKGDGFAFLIKK
jgi:hypothetical protein